MPTRDNGPHTGTRAGILEKQIPLDRQPAQIIVGPSRTGTGERSDPWLSLSPVRSGCSSLHREYGCAIHIDNLPLSPAGFRESEGDIPRDSASLSRQHRWSETSHDAGICGGTVSRRHVISDLVKTGYPYAFKRLNLWPCRIPQHEWEKCENINLEKL